MMMMPTSTAMMSGQRQSKSAADGKRRVGRPPGKKTALKADAPSVSDPASGKAGGKSAKSTVAKATTTVEPKAVAKTKSSKSSDGVSKAKKPDPASAKGEKAGTDKPVDSAKSGKKPKAVAAEFVEAKPPIDKRRAKLRRSKLCRRYPPKAKSRVAKSLR